MKKYLSLLLALLMVFSLAACGSQTQTPSSTGSDSETVNNADKVDDADNPGERSVTVTDMSGTEVTITGEIKQIIHLWPSGTSSFFVLGAGDLIAGVSNNGPGVINAWSKYFYPGAADIPSLGGTEPSVEDIVAKSPDLVIVHPTSVSSGLAQQILDLGIPAVNLNYSNFEDMVRSYTILGEILGGKLQEKLTTWCDDTQSTLKAHRELAASLSDEDKPVVYYINGQDLMTTMPAGQIMQDWVESNGGIYASTMMEVTGNGMQGSNVTAEEVFRVNPDVIIVGGTNQHTLIDQLKNTDGWKDLDAVKNGRVYGNPYGCFNWDRFGLESLLQLDYALLRVQPELAAEQGITEESMIQEIIDFYSYYNGTQMTVEEASNMFNGLLPDGTMENPVA